MNGRPRSWSAHRQETLTSGELAGYPPSTDGRRGGGSFIAGLRISLIIAGADFLAGAAVIVITMRPASLPGPNPVEHRPDGGWRTGREIPLVCRAFESQLPPDAQDVTTVTIPAL
jgi:hypothetical protein